MLLRHCMFPYVRVMTGCMPCVVSVNLSMYLCLSVGGRIEDVYYVTPFVTRQTCQRVRFCREIRFSQLSSVHFFFYQIWSCHNLVKVADRKGIWFFDHHSMTDTQQVIGVSVAVCRYFPCRAAISTQRYRV